MKSKGLKTGNSVKIQSITELLFAIGLIIVINVLGSYFFARLDLTKEKRYTLSDASKNLAKKLDDIVYVKIHLDGDDLPPGFKRLRNSTREMLEEFRAFSGGKIEYEISDPLDGVDTKKRNEILKDFIEKGIQATNIQEGDADQIKQKIVIPAASFYYKSKEFHVNLLRSQFGAKAEEVLNESIEALEYEISNTLRKCLLDAAKRIAFIEGHGELTEDETADIRKELSDFYKVEKFNLNFDDTSFFKQFLNDIKSNDPDSVQIELVNLIHKKLSTFDALIIAKPRISFSEMEKYYLDQYFMGGGKLIWLIDPIIAEMDSIGKYEIIMTADYQLNITDQLFKYGVRVNPDIVQDIQCHVIPILGNFMGGQPTQELVPWIYYPIITHGSENVIVRNVDPVWLNFPASIDTLPKEGVKKTVLLKTSKFSRISSNPARVDLGIVQIKPDPRYFTKPSQITAVMLEGKFESAFKGRNTMQFDPIFKLIEKTDSNKLLVISDGDLIRNQIKKGTGEIYPLGYDRFSNQMFGNKKFFVNAVDYMLDASGIMEIRTREVKLRLLNKAKIKEEKGFWQLVNIIVPVVLIIVFGIINGLIRKRKYS